MPPLRSTLDYIVQVVLPGAARLLPPTFSTPDTATLMLAIGLQESEFAARRQHGGPARSFWQYEVTGGCWDLLHRPAARGHMRDVLALLQYSATLDEVDLHTAMEHNDILAAVGARLLLRTIPDPVPSLDAHPDVSWDQYMRTWRPGAPRRAHWDRNLALARDLVVSRRDG